jgi:hypothetical protein
VDVHLIADLRSIFRNVDVTSRIDLARQIVGRATIR